MDPIKFKSVVTALIVVSGALLVVLWGSGPSVTANQSLGIGIDFGEREVVWSDIDLKLHGDPYDALDYACKENGFIYSIDSDRVLVSLNGVTNDPFTRWGLWVVEKESLNWKKLDAPYDVDLIDFTVSMWAYCFGTETPAIAVDQTGKSIYGYPQAIRTITLSPSLTEIIGSLNAVNTLVGTDKYSNYPNEVSVRQSSGEIKIIGDFLSPSYELIMKEAPDVVFCDGSQYTHYEMSSRLIRSGVNSVVMYGGESVDTILNNIYIMGTVMGYELRAIEVISYLEYAEEALRTLLETNATSNVNVMVALSPDISPWVSGSYTYMSDILSKMFGVNVFSDKNGWVHINSEMIARFDPDVIIVLSDEYTASQSEYNYMFSHLPGEWKSTKAWNTGRVYMICEDAAEMAQRAGPRFAQLMELVARILHPGAFTGGDISKFIGSDYERYLSYTDSLGFN